MDARAVSTRALTLVIVLLGLTGLAVAQWWLSWGMRPPAAETMLERLDDYGPVPAFRLIERSGRTVGREDLRGFVWVANFIYTECTETCPTQSLQFARLQEAFTLKPEVRLVSITVDPQHDTPPVLRRHAEQYGATDRWWFLTGDQREIYCLAQQGFRLSVVDPSAPEAPACGAAALRLGPPAAWASHGSHGLVMHTARAVLVDRGGRIRAYHFATEPDSMAHLRDNIRRLLQEPAEEKSR